MLYKPVFIDEANDTAYTIEQIDYNNITYDTLCDWN